MRVPPGADRDFTASAYVVDADRVLLVHHTKFNRWIQPGGHVEPRETPDEAAIREVREETGVRARIEDSFVPSRSPTPHSENLPQPFRVNVHEVRPDHWHVDFAYLARVETRGAQPETDEHGGQRWFGLDTLAELDGIDEQTRATARRAIRTVATGRDRPNP